MGQMKERRVERPLPKRPAPIEFIGSELPVAAGDAASPPHASMPARLRGDERAAPPSARPQWCRPGGAVEEFSPPREHIELRWQFPGHFGRPSFLRFAMGTVDFRGRSPPHVSRMIAWMAYGHGA
eukprot:15063835-Alexandrium_andersonii.AAC.1